MLVSKTKKKKIRNKNKKEREVEYNIQAGAKCRHFEKAENISPNIRSR